MLKQGVKLDEVYKTLQNFMGGYFVNYFNRFGRQWQVYLSDEGRKPRPVNHSSSSGAKADAAELALPLSDLAHWFSAQSIGNALALK